MKLFKNIAIVAVLIVALDFAAGKVLETMFFNQRGGLEFKTQYAIKEADAEMLIFGSSRAYRHFNSLVLEKELGKTCFNLGRMGQSVFYHTALLKTILKRHRPEIVLLDVDPNELFYQPIHYDRLSCLLPYFKKHKTIKETIIDLRGKKEVVKNLSQIYPYNSTIVYSIRNKVLNDDPNFFKQKGYKPYKKPLTEKSYQQKLAATAKFDALNKSKIDSSKVQYLEEFIATCQNNGIKLFISISPMLYKIPADESYQKLLEICSKFDVSVFDNYGKGDFGKVHDYYDLNHLNIHGADSLTTMVALEIKALH